MNARSLLVAVALVGCAREAPQAPADAPEDVAAVRSVFLTWSRYATTGKYDSLSTLAAPEWVLIEAGRRFSLPELVDVIKSFHADSIIEHIDTTTIHTGDRLGYVVYAAHATIWSSGKQTPEREMGTVVLERAAGGWRVAVMTATAPAGM